mmetsp:Transcript_57774/g.152008  ORF Transcript_57774/g.152008 Transcript_57774/m.152008 type:complete len:123 (-) Transcript_57774:190-558(-)
MDLHWGIAGVERWLGGTLAMRHEWPFTGGRLAVARVARWISLDGGAADEGSTTGVGGKRKTASDASSEQGARLDATGTAQRWALCVQLTPGVARPCETTSQAAALEAAGRQQHAHRGSTGVT